MGVGPNTKKVSYHYDRMLNQLGPELAILNTLEIDQIETLALPYLGEAIQRVRQNDIKLDPGYDGEFGKLILFNKKEKEQLSGQKKLFNIPKQAPDKPTAGLDRLNPPAGSLFVKKSKKKTKQRRLKKSKPPSMISN